MEPELKSWLRGEQKRGRRHLSNAVHLNIFSLGIIPANSSDPLRSGAKDRGVKNEGERAKGDRELDAVPGKSRRSPLSQLPETNETNESPSYHLRYKNISILKFKLFRITLKFSKYIHILVSSNLILSFLKLILDYYSKEINVDQKILESRSRFVFPKFFNLIDNYVSRVNQFVSYRFR